LTNEGILYNGWEEIPIRSEYKYHDLVTYYANVLQNFDKKQLKTLKLKISIIIKQNINRRSYAFFLAGLLRSKELINDQFLPVIENKILNILNTFQPGPYQDWIYYQLSVNIAYRDWDKGVKYAKKIDIPWWRDNAFAELAIIIAENNPEKAVQCLNQISESSNALGQAQTTILLSLYRKRKTKYS